MFNTKNATIRGKLSLSLLPPIFALFVGNQIYSNYKGIARLERDLEFTADQVSHRLSRSLEIPLWDMNNDTARDIIQSEMMQQNIAGILVQSVDVELTSDGDTFWIGKGRDQSWNSIDIRSFDVKDTLQRRGEIRYQDRHIGDVVVHCTWKFVNAERNRMITGTIISSLAMAMIIVLSIYLILTAILRQTVAGLHAEARRLETAVQKGRLSDRADPNAVAPEFRGVVAGMNLITEAFVAPLRQAIRFVLTLAEGKVPARDQAPVHGEFEELRQASNALVTTVHMRNSDADLLIQAALDGRLDVRADTAKYEGYNRELVGRMNTMLAAVAKPLKLAAGYTHRIANGETPPKITEEYPGDFNILKDNLNLCIDAQHTRAETQRLEMELHQSQKLEAVGRLAAGIAHEINTPIQFIGDNTHFLGEAFATLAEFERSQEQAIPPEAREPLRQLEQEMDLPYLREQIPKTIDRTLRGVERVATIVRAMKEFAHPDQKEMVATDLNRAIQATLEVARNEYKYVAEMETDFCDLPTVTCHAGDLNQVVLNLVINAAHAIADVVKGTDHKGKIRVGTRLDGKEVVLSVSDTGTGIPKGIRDKVFEPFFTTKEVGRGTGQGLAIARSIMAKHHGSISFETEPGKGTVFLLRLPVTPPSSS